MSYFLWLNDKEAGPFTLQELQSMYVGAEINGHTLWAMEGSKEWKPIEQFPAVWSSKASSKKRVEKLRDAQPFALAGYETLRDRAERQSTFAVIALVISILCFVYSLSDGSGTAAAIAGGLASFGFCLILLSQLTHIRAGIEEMNWRERSKKQAAE